MKRSLSFATLFLVLSLVIAGTGPIAAQEGGQSPLGTAETTPRATLSHPVVLSAASDQTVSRPTNPPAPDAEVALIIDDGTVENNIGIGGTWEFIFLNRFTPDPAEFPFDLNRVHIYFDSTGLAQVGDDIIIVVYENTTGGFDPAPGSNWLYSYPTTVQAIDAWNIYSLPAPVALNGPGDVLIGVIALEIPGTSYWPAAMDQTATQQRSWAGWWLTSPPPSPPLLPPDDSWTLIDAYFPGNWMIRGYGETAGPPPPPPPWGILDLCIPAEEAPLAYVNQPWDWVEGAVDPDSTVNATLKRGGSTIATASTTAGSDGWFSFHFRSGGAHVDILPGDQIILTGGGLSDTITVVDIKGWINVAGDSVGGIASGGTFGVWGVVCVRHPFDAGFESKETYLDANGRFDVQFGGQVDIETDFVAHVVYPDPNGNYVVQVLYPEGLALNVLISEDRVEGVTTPGSTVTVIVWDASGEKGRTTTVADETGFYSTQVLDDGDIVDLVLGDHVGVSNPGHARETFLTMSHESHIQPGFNRVVGTVSGMPIPAGGTQGRVDLWSVTEQQWHSQVVWIEETGEYGADFDGTVEVGPADRIRLWVSDGDGVQQASLGAALELGVNTTLDYAWGFTTADTLVGLTLYRGLVEGVPQDVIGGALVHSDAMGFFSATLEHEGSPVSITASNVVKVENGESVRILFVGRVGATGNSADDLLTIYGPPGAVVHVTAFRPLPGEPGHYFWDEVVVEPSGSAILDLAPYDLLDGDILNLTAYLVEEGMVVERIVVVLSSKSCYLPVITK